MKLKRLPADFQVDEMADLRPGVGPFALYRLTKTNLGTPEAIDLLADRWRLDRREVAFAGLKDRHALTRQYVTIQGGPRRGLSQTNLEIEYLGQCDRAIHASDITANRFVVVLREMTDDQLASAAAALAAASRDGLPNYFDDQRFGSLGESGEFIAKPWCLGDYERALWLALADPNVHDRPSERDEKRILREHWGNWHPALQLLNQSRVKPVLEFLRVHPGDFRRAIALTRQDLRSLWLAAFQSHLWNQLLAVLLRLVCRPEQLTLQTMGGREVPFFAELDGPQREQLLATVLPLPSARLHLAGSPLQPLYERVLEAEGMELRQVRVKYPRDSFFSKGERAAILQPRELASETADDELYPGRKKLTLQFALPRGAYATIVVKRISGLVLDEEA